jgi:translation initiation factor 2 subunit 1
MADQLIAEAGEANNGAEYAQMRCRFYENQYPEPEEVVMVNVTSIGEMGAYVTLTEYDNIDGLILLSELTRRRIRSINKLVRVNRPEIVMVLRVDKEKGYIDLSKRRVDPEDVVKCEERFSKAKQVHNILTNVAKTRGVPLESLYQRVAWPLYRKYGHAHDAFKLALSNAVDEKTTDIFADIDIEPEIKDAIFTFIRRKLTPQPVKIRADIEVTCFNYEGIEAVKSALLTGEEMSIPEVPIKVSLIASPLFVLVTNTTEKDLGLETMNRALNRIQDEIRAKGGSMTVKMEPKVVDNREESELQAMLDRLAQEQEEDEEDAPEDF